MSPRKRDPQEMIDDSIAILDVVINGEGTITRDQIVRMAFDIFRAEYDPKVGAAPALEAALDYAVSATISLHGCIE